MIKVNNADIIPLFVTKPNRFFTLIFTGQFEDLLRSFHKNWRSGVNQGCFIPLFPCHPMIHHNISQGTFSLQKSVTDLADIHLV